MASVAAPATGSEALALGTVTWSSDFPDDQASLPGLSLVAQLALERVGADATHAVTDEVVLQPATVVSAAESLEVTAEQAAATDLYAGVASDKLANLINSAFGWSLSAEYRELNELGHHLPVRLAFIPERNW